MTERLKPAELPEGLELGVYRLVGCIAHGTRSVIYKAEINERFFAVKVFRYLPAPHGTVTWLLEQRFWREIALLTQLKGIPGITRIFAHGYLPEGYPFYVQEYVEGSENLLEWTARRAPSFAAFAEVLRQVGEAMDQMHRERIIHRDLKPENILITPDDRPVIIDFGSAKGPSSEELTFLGPRGDALLTTPLSDIYALGISCYQLLTGQFPFAIGKTDEETLRNISSTKARSPRELNPDVPAALAALVLHLIAKKPKKRCQNGSELVAALKQMSTTGDEWKVALRARALEDPPSHVEEQPMRPVTAPLGVTAWSRARDLFARFRRG